VDGQLSCVPGVSADPQAQIRALRQQINGLQQLVLQGEAVQGAVLQAVAAADLLASLPPSAFHWYRRNAGPANGC
jgi:cytolysin (calcineurin-like family phosphatase)